MVLLINDNRLFSADFSVNCKLHDNSESEHELKIQLEPQFFQRPRDLISPGENYVRQHLLVK